MIELNEMESKYLDLLEGINSIKEFETWVYNSDWLESELPEDVYIDLISLNFKTSSATYEIGKVLKGEIDEGNFETAKMIKLLNSIIERDGKEGESLTRMYDYYCKGYYFLEDLGLGIGLSVEVPNKYGVEYYHELNREQEKSLVDSVYPPAKELAIELKNWLLNKDLILTGDKESELNLWGYIDNRIDEDKKSRVWKVDDIDLETGKVRSKVNLLLNQNGHFKHGDKAHDNWIKRFFKRWKPNR